jgi:16S rRNA (adenine1518-N6/adenine1519-N6)-dimethyltransferase
MQAKKSLGQNFLINENVITNIVNLIDYNSDDLIIEIGPGRGALSKHLAKFNCSYIAIEIDKDMKEYLEPLNIEVIYEDILKIDLKDILNKYKYNRLFIIGNLPYYITSPILEKLVNLNIDIYKMIFMVQKEVALRYSAKEGNKDFGYMSLFLQYKYDVKKEFDVSKGNFSPIPKVDSSIIVLKQKQNNYNVDFNKYTSFLKEAFQMKRKTLKNNLKHYNWDMVSKVLKDNNLNELVRAEDISQEIFIEIYKAIENDI